MPNPTAPCTRWKPRRGLLGLILGALLLASVCAPAADGLNGIAGEDATVLLFSSTFRQIRDYYLEPVSLPALSLAGLEGLNAADGSFAVSEDAGHHRVVLTQNGTVLTQLTEPEEGNAYGWGDLIAKTIAIGRAHSKLLAQENDEELYQHIFDGLLPKLDRFSHYAGSDKARDQRAARDGFGGIGVTLDYTEHAPRISTITPGGPSFRAGVRVDDRIIAIDGIASNALDQHQIVERLRGAIESPVQLTLARPGSNAPLSLTITRGLIVQPTVTTETADNIAIFHIDSFNVSTAMDLTQEIHRVRKGLKGAILDLRNNPGGLLDQGAAVAAMFLDHGDIVSTRGRNPSATQYFTANAADQLNGLPLVVLVNGASASASEIVAAALQDDDRAILVGSASFGKGTVQMVLRLENSGELTLTWARLYAPSGYLLHQHGVVPNFCTDRRIDPLAPPEDEATRLQTIIDSGLHPLKSSQIQPRTTLTEAAWSELRETCEPENRDNATDVALAKRLILDPKLFRQAMSLTPVTVAHAEHAATSRLQ